MGLFLSLLPGLRTGRRRQSPAQGSLSEERTWLVSSRRRGWLAISRPGTALLPMRWLSLRVFVWAVAHLVIAVRWPDRPCYRFRHTHFGLDAAAAPEARAISTRCRSACVAPFRQLPSTGSARRPRYL